MRSRLRTADGNALVTAILVMMLFLAVGMATLSSVDVEQSASGRERVEESSFALSEGVLNSQIFNLSRQWPGAVGQEYPAECSVATAADTRCPDVAALRTGFTGSDYAAGQTWTTEVHDDSVANGSTTVSNYYVDADVRLRPRYDENRNGYLWVRARSVLRGRPRTIVALVKAEDLSLQFPRNAVVAGRVNIGPNGNQTYIDTGGSYVTLRCANTGLNDPTCRGWSRDRQVGPGEIRPNPTQPSALSAEKIERLRETARASGTYFAGGCPDLTGAVVFLEVATTSCGYSGNNEYNTEAAPGVLVIGSGVLSLGGRTRYTGVVYHVNASDGGQGGTTAPATGSVVQLSGNACVFGSVVIDGQGGLAVGASSGANRCNGNLEFNANVANNLRAFGTAGIVQNSFREIVAP